MGYLVTRRLEDLRRSYHERLREPRTPVGLSRTVDDLFAAPIVNINRVARARSITAAMARQYVDRLVTAGILDILDPTRQRNRLYVASGIMEAIEAPEEAL